VSTPSPATPAELLASLLATLPTALPTTMTAAGPAPTAGNDLYEAYLFGIVLRAARMEGFSVAFANADGPATVLRLRRAPGRLSTGGPPAARFTHAVLACPSRPALEVHTGVGVVGKSKVVHEADVLVLPQAAADRCRDFDLDPRGYDAELLLRRSITRIRSDSAPVASFWDCVLTFPQRTRCSLRRLPAVRWSACFQEGLCNMM
jgi:hypothetical protein